MPSGITITDGDGKTIALEEYLEKQERKEKLKEDQAKAVEYNKEAKVPLFKPPRVKRQKMKDFVAQTKFYNREGTEMSEEGRYTEARKTVIRNILKSYEEWKTGIDLLAGVPYNLSARSDRATCRSMCSDVTKFFITEKMMIRKKNPEGRGFVYKFLAKTENPEAEVEPIYEQFISFFNAAKQERHIAKTRGVKTQKAFKVKEPIIPPVPSIQKPETKVSPEEITQKVNVELKVNIHVRFFWGN